jgi:hypothetical protein
MVTAVIAWQQRTFYTLTCHALLVKMALVYRLSALSLSA